jgi:hypothetical protein
MMIGWYSHYFILQGQLQSFIAVLPQEIRNARANLHQMQTISLGQPKTSLALQGNLLVDRMVGGTSTEPGAVTPFSCRPLFFTLGLIRVST